MEQILKHRIADGNYIWRKKTRMYRGKFTLEYPKTVWKKCHGRDNSVSIVELELPAGSTVVEPYKRTYSVNKKCRANKAIVKKIYTMYVDTNEAPKYRFIPFNSAFLIEDPEITKTYSVCEPDFEYEIGETVQVYLDEDPTHKCGAGINFFNTLREAVSWGTLIYLSGQIDLEIHKGNKNCFSRSLTKVLAKREEDDKQGRIN